MRIAMKKLLLKGDADPWDPAELKRWREVHGLTQTEAAFRLGTTERSIENWEQGSRVPYHRAMIRRLMRMTKPRKPEDEA